MKVRKITELLQLMLDNLHLIRNSGLCLLVICLTYEQSINIDEARLLHQYLKAYKPFLRTYFRMSDYWYKRGKVKPRETWLKKRLKKEQQRES